MGTLGGRGTQARVGWMVAAWLVSLAGAPGVVSAITRNVDNTVACSDTAPCTVTPCCTIQFAIDVAVANDVIEVAAGSYAENLTLAKNLNLRGVQAGNPACDRVDVETVVAPASGVGLTLATGAASATINGLTFSGAARGIDATTGPLNNLKIFSNRFVGFTGSGAFFGTNAPSMRFEQNAIDGTSATGPNGLFHLDGNNDFDGLKFLDTCVQNGVSTYGFFADGDHNLGPSVDAGLPLIEDSRFENNRIGVSLGSQSGDQMSIARNSFAMNGLDGLQGGAQNSTIDGNTFDANGRCGLLLTSFGNADPASGAQNDSITNNCFSANGLGTACTGGSNDGTPCTSNAACTGGGTCTVPLAGAGIFYSDTQASGTIATNVASDNNIYGNFAGAAYAGGESIDAENNWWGCATGANTGLCDTASPNVSTNPFLVVPSATTPCEPLAGPTPTPGLTSTPSATPTAAVTVTATPTPSTSPTPTIVNTDPATPTATPTASVTATPTGTATATATIPGPTPTPGPLDHFQCYETHRPPSHVTGISLVDHFGASTVNLRRAKRFCAPADKNDEDPTAPLDPDHLTVYTIGQTAPRFERVRDFSVTNQFGTIVLDLVRPDALLVPSAKSHVGPIASYTPLVDHFKCYKARGRFRSGDLNVDDQFGSIIGAIKRPVRYCAPVDKNGEGIIDGATHLLCYQLRSAAGTPTHDTLYSLNQFGPDSFNVYGPRELCVPSTID